VTPAARDVYRRAGKTTAQALVSSAAIAYARYQANPHGTLLWPGVLAGLAGAGAGGASVLWNGTGAILGARRARKLAALVAWGEQLKKEAVAAALAGGTAFALQAGPNPPTP